MKPFVDWFRSAAPYIRAHQGKTFVIAFGGEVFRSSGLGDLVADLALIHALGVRLVIVVGSRPQIDRKLKKAGRAPRFEGSLRITDAASMEAAKAAAGENRVELERALSTAMPGSTMANARIQVAAGNFVIARPLGVLEGIDYQYTGRVRRIETESIHQRLDDGAMVILSSLGYSLTGDCFNLSTPELAADAAVALGADKLVMLTESKGVRVAGKTVSKLGPNEARAIEDRSRSAVLRATLAASRNAVEGGVQRAHIVPRKEEAGLLRELFTRDGIGTLITGGMYEGVRRATLKDVPDLLRLLEPLERSGSLVRRPRMVLENDIDKFFVVERDAHLLGCAALYPYPEDGSAELACLAVDAEHRASGRGDALLEAVEEAAREEGLDSLFVLTTQSAHWFQERGFQSASPKTLPLARSKYDRKRKSRVLRKRL